MSDVKLLSEAEWRKVLATPGMTQILAELRERGLIAAEPVDALDAVWPVFRRTPGSHETCTPKARSGALRAALAEIGMELQREAQPALTVEAVRGAVNACDFYIRPETVTRLHAALTNPPHAGEGV